MNSTGISGKEEGSGKSQGSELLAKYPSVRSMTGVRCVKAILAASMATSKQSEGVLAETIGSGASPCLPYIASNRSEASVLVGNPVEGPPRWTSTKMSGNSRETANPSVSDLRATPGPLVVVTPR